MTKPDIKVLSQLARLAVSPQEEAKLAHDLEGILEFVGQIQGASTGETKNVEGIPKNVLREDGEPHAKGIYTEDLLAAAPSREKNFVKVKKIL
ncbi:MAG: Asp-tRNA(Asn)/Glu-tRNA(Gln) amidotransferase subunit GatC [Patescibacteria group bacterium]